MSEGIDWCHRHPDALADGGYRLSKEAIILYTMSKTTALGAPRYSDQLHRARASPRPRFWISCATAYGQDFLDDIPKPLGRVSDPGRTGRGAAVPE